MNVFYKGGTIISTFKEGSEENFLSVQSRLSCTLHPTSEAFLQGGKEPQLPLPLEGVMMAREAAFYLPGLWFCVKTRSNVLRQQQTTPGTSAELGTRNSSWQHTRVPLAAIARMCHCYPNCWLPVTITQNGTIFPHPHAALLSSEWKGWKRMHTYNSILHSLLRNKPFAMNEACFQEGVRNVHPQS